MTPKPHDPAATTTRSLTPERFARVRAIFEAALDRRPFERRAFVDGACVGDETLRRDVLDMLSAEAKDDALLDRPAPTPSLSTPDEGRFPAGTVLAGRYRILGLLGTGGMGEVYRAHDLILNQPVALKFLTPGHLSEAALLRFRNEVRIARQVSHPHVCRVYDLGMVEGLHFLSMEYIDGEDLASLLRRIGRLPPDKALELTRKICAGLAAAHERGVLHRDLKPANIMIDGRGQPRITDFGLAALAAEIPLSDLRSGTPAYMSPEQKAGKDVTARSDIYALGLVLHEMFTGRRREDSSSSPTELVKDFDPAIERLILRCLEEDPKRRPASALAVAMSLPGGDPIAAALAAGETPSPEMVAASREKEGFSPPVAIACFLALVVLLIPAGLSTGWRAPSSRAPVETHPEALADRAREMLRRLGYPNRAVSRAFGLECCDRGHLRHVEQMDPERRDAVLASYFPPVSHFWYRQHLAPLVALPSGSVSYDQPPNDQAGMIRLQLNAKGDLIVLEVRPARDDPSTQAMGSVVGADELFELADLDPGRFRVRAPTATPPMAFDVQESWIGTYSDDLPGTVLVDAAWWEGRLVWFRVNGDWQLPPASQESVQQVVPLLLTRAALIAALFVAWHNIRLGRGDRRGAGFIAGIAFVTGFAGRLLSINYAPVVGMIDAVTLAAAIALFWAMVLWVFYIAIEPYVRRRMPGALISLARLQAGRVRDPLVASHVLAGIVIVLGAMLVFEIVMTYVARSWMLHGADYLRSLDGSASLAATLLVIVTDSFRTAMMLVVAMVALQPLLRRNSLTDIAACLLHGFLGSNVFTGPIGVVMNATFAYVGLVMLRRFGFLTLLVGWWTYIVLWSVPPSLTAWYADRFLFTLSLPAALGIWALWVILSDAGRTSADPAA